MNTNQKGIEAQHSVLEPSSSLSVKAHRGGELLEGRRPVEPGPYDINSAGQSVRRPSPFGSHCVKDERFD